jgi:superfamily II DNA/RNA helicase
MKEYVHRAGRLAQAGQAGHALLFLLPLERQYVEVLELHSLRDISPLLLSLTLLLAAVLCRGLMQEGELRASTGSYSDADGDDVDPDDGNGRPP